mmetsp:Transcript_56260/g.131904  ORF Transcript_56260/g.131904 Transcript_56260/m.131904 type:complete len:206 (-) Transcript_56260:102-719(-)
MELEAPLSLVVMPNPGGHRLHNQSAENTCTSLRQHEAAQQSRALGFFQPTFLLFAPEGEDGSAEQVVVHRHANTQAAGKALLSRHDPMAGKEIQHPLSRGDTVQTQISTSEKSAQLLSMLSPRGVLIDLGGVQERLKLLLQAILAAAKVIALQSAVGIRPRVSQGRQPAFRTLQHPGPWPVDGVPGQQGLRRGHNGKGGDKGAEG